MAVCALALNACSSNESSKNSPTSTVEIVFPPAQSLTDGNDIVLRGTATPGTTALFVNGVSVTTDDAFANWSVRVPLAAGFNELLVTSDDENVLARAEMRSTPLLLEPVAVALDSTANQAFVVDSRMATVTGIDLVTGLATIVSAIGVPDSSNPMFSPSGIVLDKTNQRLLVADLNRVVAIDLREQSRGGRTILSGSSTPNGGSPFIKLAGITLDSANSRALVVDSGKNAIVAVDLDPNNLGVRTVLSENGTGNPANPFAAPRGIALDSSHERALVVDPGLRAIVAVDLTGANLGDRTILSGSNTPNAINALLAPQGIHLDAVNNRALVTDIGLQAVVSVDLDSATLGARTIVSDNGSPSSVALEFPWGIALDEENSSAVVIDSRLRAAVSVDLTPGKSGARSMLFHSGAPDVVHSLQLPIGIALDPANSHALVTDAQRDAVIAVSLDKESMGVRTIVSDGDTPNSANPLVSPGGIALDSASERAFVVDEGLAAIVAIELDANNFGARTIVSDSSKPNAANPLIAPRALVYDDNANRILVVDDGADAVFAIDMSPGNEGARSILSNGSFPNADNLFVTPQGIVVDASHNRAIVVDTGRKAIVAVDLSPQRLGQRTILSDNNTPNANIPFVSPAGIALDSLNQRILVTDNARTAVIAVDLRQDTVGERTILSDSSTSNGSNVGSPTSIALDRESQLAFTVDVGLRAIIAVDVTNGERVILSR